MFLEVIRICHYHKPKVIFCENVKGLVSHDRGKTFRIILNSFAEIGYKVFWKILNSKDFGVPQNRERVYLVAFRQDLGIDEFKFLTGDEKVSCIRDIMENAPIPAKYYLSENYLGSLRKYKAKQMLEGNGYGYVLRDINSIAGTIVCGGMGHERNLIVDDRPHSMISETYKGAVNKENIRKMTPREWARLQGFPDSFKLILSDTQLYKQLGNTVTVPVIEAIAKKVQDALES